MHGFKINDVVQLADATLFPGRIGIIVGASGSDIQVEVLWHELQTPQLVDWSLLRIAKLRHQDRRRRGNPLDGPLQNEE
jgi:hypothetical protein